MPQKTYDTLLELKSAGLIAADAAVATILDLMGDPSGTSLVGFANTEVAEVRGDLLLNVTAIEIATGDESYNMILQGSNSATFASGIEELASCKLGAKAAMSGGANGVDGVVGQYEIPFTNKKGATTYRYVRMYTDVTGTIATGINYTARLGKAANTTKAA